MNRIFDVSIRSRWRWVVSVVIFAGLVACQQDGESRSADISPVPATTTVELSKTPNMVPTLIGTGTTAFETDEPKQRIEMTATSDITATETVCGVLLPILESNPVEPVSSLRKSEVNLDSVPAEAQAALRRMLASPSSVGLVAFEIGKAIDPSSWVPVSEIESAYLPGSDLGAHRASLAELEEKGLITEDDPSIPMEQIPWMMMRHSSNSASDYLQTLIGQRVIESTVLDLDLPTHTAPCPFIGQFLAISNHNRPGDDRQAIQSYLDEPERYGREVDQLIEAFMTDPEFRSDEGYWRAPISSQRYFAEQLNSKASANDYAKLMAMISKNEIGSDFVNILIRRAIEWPMIYPVNQSLFSSVGYKNGD